MFNNRKPDPLIDSVKSIMQESDLRRKVEEALNEELGVSSRKAIPHENLSQYDSMLEEAYKCAMKESDAVDYSHDSINVDPTKYRRVKGKQNPYPENMNTGKKAVKEETEDNLMYHVVSPDGRTVMTSNQKGDAENLASRFGKEYKVYPENALPSHWIGSGTGSSLFAGKKKTMKESHGSAPRTAREADLAAAKPPYNKITKADVLKKRGVIRQEATEPAPKVMPTQTRDNPSTPKSGWTTTITKEEKEYDDLSKKEKRKLDVQAMRDYVKIRREKKKSGDRSKTKRSSMQPYKDTSLDEAAYSAKAARAGKDIGKPGKMFAKIAAKAGEKYGSKKRGEKVAGAVLAKIRAKHMKEETLEEKAPPGAKFERMVKHIKAGYKEGGLTKKEKGIAYATAWKEYDKEKGKKIEESVNSIIEEIRSNLEEKLVSVYESGDEQMFEDFVSSLTEEQIDLLGLNELFHDPFGQGYTGDVSIRNRAMQQTSSNAARQAAGQRSTSVARPAPSAAPRPASAAPAARPTPVAARPAAPSPAAGARAAAEIKPGEGQKPAPVTGQPPLGSPQYQGAKEAGAGNADLMPSRSSLSNVPIAPTFQPSRDKPGTAATGATNADLMPSRPSIPEPTPPSERRGTGNAFARAAKAQQAGTAGLQESLESFLRKNYIKD